MASFNVVKKFPTLSTLLMLELLLLLVIAYQLQVSRRVNVLEKTSLVFFGPVQQLTHNLVGSVSHALEAKKTRTQLEEENRRLISALAGLEQLRTQLEEAELENERLRQVVALPPNDGWDLVTAQVIGRVQRRNDYMITINQGANAGLRVDMGVFSPSGVVGIIWEVSGDYAKVMTANNPASVVAALVGDSRYQESFVSGFDLHTGQLNNFPNFEQIQYGDLVLTSGLDGVFPKGLHLARVISAQPSSYLFQDVRVKFTTDFTRLEEVVVLVPQCEEVKP